MKLETSAFLEAAWDFIKAILPGGFGAAVAVAMDRTATLGRRFVQFAVGIIVSYYVGAAIIELTSFGPMVRQGISFTVGMVAYQSVPEFTSATAKTLADVPRDLWAWVKKKIGA
ncbi:hypothetical protein [Sphingopyxis flava]|uniref:Holin n=1 Tax=Sphingopyxis flava TaxID=1507287 RepID=A0A1T5BR09_9SPHN|nr:hypothetical protein [Sphingopyxis flava]SKB49822.1 hypothetical protein SAMN06295937_100778 [Sphingopyxis flava]